MEDYKKKYEDALDNFKKIKAANKDNKELVDFIEYNYPELKESEDEEIREWLLKSMNYISEGSLFFDKVSKDKVIAWLEKQGEIKCSDYPYVPGWRENRPDNKPKIKHSILMLTTHGVAEGEWLGEEWCQYRWSCKVKDKDVLYWLHLSDLENLEKEIIEQTSTDENVEPKFKVGDWIIDNKQINCTNSVMRINKVGLTDYRCQYNNGLASYHFDFVDKNYRLWTIQDAKDGDVLSNEEMIVIFKHFEEPSCRQHIVAYIGLDTCGNIQITDDTWNLGIDKAKPATKEQRDLLFSKMKEAGYEWDAEKKELRKIEPIQCELPKGEDYGIDGLYHAARILKYTLGEVDGYQSDDGILEHKCAIEVVNRLYKQKLAWSEEDEVWLNDIIADAEQEALLNKEQISWLKSLKPPKNWKPYWCEDCKMRHSRWRPTEEQLETLTKLKNTTKDPSILHVLTGLYRDLKKL